MANEVNNTAEEQTENQTSAAEKTNNGEAAGAAVKTQTAEENTAAGQDETVTNETAETATQGTAETQTAAQTEAKNETAAAETESAAAQENAGEIDFGAILEQFETEQIDFRPGDTVEGTVVEMSDRGVLIDFGYKSEGLAPIEDFTNKKGEPTVAVGDKVEVVIKNLASNDAPPSLSYSDAQQRAAWDAIELAYRNDEPLTVHLLEQTKGGLKVDVGGVEGFMPGSHVDSRPNVNLDDFVGQDVEAKVIRFSRSKDNIVVSRKVITDAILEEKKKETLENIEEKNVVEGTITNLLEYGAFVDIGGIDGLLHITDMTWGRTPRPSDIFKVGETIQVKILKLNRDKEKVSLGYKQLLPDPWETVPELYPVGSRVKGTVTSVTDYGAFVELEPNVEGLVHVSEMSYSKRNQHPKQFVRKGDEIEVQVLGIDLDERRISLGIKQLQPDPWQTFLDTYQTGDKVRGEIRNLTDFGAFIEILPGVEGLIHLSDISWSRKINHPKDVLKRGQEVDAVITKLSPSERKISLSMKELTPTAWETFLATHKSGDTVTGKITRFANFGVFVELTDELEGLCHISELTEGRIENPEDEFHVGQELQFKILRIEPENQKIGLSHRAVGREDEEIPDTKSYSTQAKGGMASLAELANLKIGGGKSGDEEAETKKSAKAKAKGSEDTGEKTVDQMSEPEQPSGDLTVEAETGDQAKAETADAETSETEASAETEAEESAQADAGAEESKEESRQAEEISAETDAAETSENQESAETAEAPAEETTEAAEAESGSEANAETDSSSETSEDAAAQADAENAGEENKE